MDIKRVNMKLGKDKDYRASPKKDKADDTHEKVTALVHLKIFNYLVGSDVEVNRNNHKVPSFRLIDLIVT